jgi:hypothetical protein
LNPNVNENPNPPIEAAPTAPAAHVVFSAARVWAIASNTLLELIRLKVFYFLLIFGFLVIGVQAIAPEFDYFHDQPFQVLKDVCLGAIDMFTWLLSILVTASLLPKDIEDRTLYTILAKPVPRFEYLLGKLAGVLLLLLISTLVMTAVSALALYIRQEVAIGETIRTSAGVPPDVVHADIQDIYNSTFSPSLAGAVAIIYVKAALFASLTLFISTFASSTLFTIVVSITCAFIGILQGVARDVWLGAGMTGSLSTAGPLPRLFLDFVVLVFPDMRLFNVADDIVAGNSISFSLFSQTVAMGGFYLCIYFLVAYIVFAWKEL